MSDEHENLPPELDWDQMEEGILEKMDDLSHTDFPRNKYLKGTVLVLGVLLFSLLFNNYCNTALDKNDISYMDITTREEVTQKVESNNTVTNPTSVQIEDKALEIALEKSSKKSNPILANFSATANKQVVLTENSSDTTSDIKKQNDELFSNSALDSYNAGNSTREIERENTVQDNYLNINALETEDEDVISSNENKDLETIRKVSTSNFTLENPTLLNQVPSILDNSESRFQITSGITFWAMGYGKNKPERSVFENSRLSYHTGFNYIHTLKNNYTFLVGLQYQQLENRFVRSIKDQQIITFTDTVVEIRTNLLTGESTPIYGDVDLLVDVEHYIRHYNRTHLYQIPFAVGKTWKSNKWQTDFLIGGSINIATSNKGRTFIDGELQFYDRNSTNHIENQLGFNAMTKGQVSYFLNDRLGITTGLQVQKSITNWSTETDINMKPHWINMDFGLTFKL